MGIDHKRFDLKSFQPPTTDHHSNGPPSSIFSPHQVANNTIRWRRAPSDNRKLQSNARMLRWSDGSVTMQLAANPMEQYELPAKSHAPPQVNPLKPTPTSIKRAQASGPTPYDPDLDTHTYLAYPHESASSVRIVRQMTASLTVQSTNAKDTEDDALIRLKESLAAASKANKGAAEGMLQITEDPELAKKKAEVAEKEKMRAQKRRQNQEEKERDRTNRQLGRVGLRTTGAAGLTVGGLEDDDGPVRTRAKPVRKPRRRNSEYSEDEEDYRNRGRTKEDEYDVDDGFLVGSEEEPELVDDDEEDEDVDMVDEEEEEDRRKKSKGRSAVKAAKEDVKPSTENVATEDVVSGVRGKRRTVVDDDEDEE